MLEFGILDIWVYVLGAFAIIVMPGPNTLFVLKTGVVDGRKPAFAALSAVLFGDSVLMLCSYLGVAAAIAAHPGVFQWIRLAGGAYLAWLGAKVIYHVLTSEKKAKGIEQNLNTHAVNQTAATGSRAVKAFRTALVLSLTNPKAILFFVAFFVQFIDPTFEPKWIPYLILAAILQTFSISWLVFLSTIGADLLRMAARFPALARLGNTSMGGLFLLFSAKLVLDA